MIINTLYTEHPVSVQHGEVDCWPQDCPPLPCPRPQHRPGTCCPVCEGGDTCGERVAMSNNETWCLDRGHAARDAGDTWHVTSLAGLQPVSVQGNNTYYLLYLSCLHMS